VRLGEGADRIAAIVESARLAEAGRARRGALSFLAEAGELLAGSLDPDRTLALAAQLVVPALARWCAVHRVDEAGRSSLALVWHADEDLHDPLEKAIRESGPPTETVSPQDWPVLPTNDRSLLPGELLVVPLSARGRQLGTLTLATPAEHRFPHDTAELAWDLGRRVAVTYDSALAYAGRRETAHALQSSLLPPRVPDVAGADIAVVYHPAGNTEAPAHLSQDALVGGDFYDVFEIRPGCWGFAIGDVCGTGPQAAAVTGLARHALRLLAREGLRPPGRAGPAQPGDPGRGRARQVPDTAVRRGGAAGGRFPRPGGRLRGPPAAPDPAHGRQRADRCAEPAAARRARGRPGLPPRLADPAAGRDHAGVHRRRQRAQKGRRDARLRRPRGSAGGVLLDVRGSRRGPHPARGGRLRRRPRSPTTWPSWSCAPARSRGRAGTSHAR